MTKTSFQTITKGFHTLSLPMCLYIIILCLFIYMHIIYIVYHLIAHANTYCRLLYSGEDLGKLVSDPSLLYLANTICLIL
jgi:hypothetical protein